MSFPDLVLGFLLLMVVLPILTLLAAMLILRIAYHKPKP